MRLATQGLSASDKIFAIVLGLFWATVIVLLLLVNIQNSPFSGTIGANRAVVALIMPEGWAFFTKNPREAQVHLVQANEGRFQELNLRDTRANPLVALNRIGRIRDLGIGRIVGGIKEWKTCPSGLEKCDLTKLKVLEIERSIAIVDVCGSYVIDLVEPVPWAWANIIDWKEQPGKIAKVNIHCSQKAKI